MAAVVVFTGGEELVVGEDVQEVVTRLTGGQSSMVELVDAQSGERTFVNPPAVAWVRALSESESSSVRGHR